MTAYCLLESFYNLLKDWFIKYQSFSLHHSIHITTGKEFSCLKDDTIGTRIEHIHPELLIEYLTCEDKYLDVWMHLFSRTAYLHSDSSRASKSEIQEEKVSESGGVNVRYRTGWKGRWVGQLVDLLAEKLPECTVRYAF